jgi:hypothetical protein
MELNEADIEELFNQGQLIIEKDVKWKRKKGFSHYEFVIPVENNFRGEMINLTLMGTKNCQTRDYSYCLLFNRQRIRALDPFKKHTNCFPKKERIKGTHKHKWCDQINSSYAYKPTDITDDTNMELTFHQFLNECSIIFNGKYTDPPPNQLQIHLEGC